MVTNLEWKDLISAAALIVSGVTAYFSLFRRGNLKVSFGEAILIRTKEDGALIFMPEIAFYNPGTTLAITKQIDFVLVNTTNDDRAALVWTENVTTVFREQNRDRDTRFEGFPSTLFIPGKQAVSKRVRLEARRAISLTAGDYEIVANIETEGTSRKSVTAVARIRFVDSDIKFLDQNRPAPGAVWSWNLFMLFQRGRHTNCFLTAPGFNYGRSSTTTPPQSSDAPPTAGTNPR